MGLLKSVSNVPGIHFYEYRDSQYYNKFDYRLRAKIPCVRYTWWCKKPEDLDEKLLGKSKKFGTIRKEDKKTVIDNLDALKAIILLQKGKKSKNLSIRIENSTVAIFSNDLAALTDIEKTLGPKYACDYTQVQTSQYAGIKHFVKEPKHKYRVYLRSKRVDDEFPNKFRAMLDKQPNLHPSPALAYWLVADRSGFGAWRYRWSSSSYFIDYDDESTLSYLALMYGEMLGKKYKLEKRPDNI
jgi:hypothetical protein